MNKGIEMFGLPRWSEKPSAPVYSDANILDALKEIIIKYFSEHKDDAIPAAHQIVEDLHRQLSGDDPRQWRATQFFNKAWNTVYDAHQVEALDACLKAIQPLLNRSDVDFAHIEQNKAQLALEAIVKLLESSKSKNWSAAQYGIGEPALNTRLVRSLFASAKIKLLAEQSPNSQMPEPPPAVVHVLTLSSDELAQILGAQVKDEDGNPIYENGRTFLSILKRDVATMTSVSAISAFAAHYIDRLQWAG